MSKNKLVAVVHSCIAMLIFACACTPRGELSNSELSGTAISASTEETAEKIKVFVGDIADAPENYVQQRLGYLSDIADTSESVKALIGLDDYYTADDVITLAKEYEADIDHVYMWPEGETGRLMLFVEDGDLYASIETYKQQIKADDCSSPEILNDYQSFLDGKYGVFAIAVTAPAKTLEEMSLNADCVSYVDVMYNPEVEAYAEQVGKAVSYIELPAKPDGAL